MLTEQSVIASINVRETGHIEVRREDRIIRGGVVVAYTNFRHVLAPGDDLTAEDPRVRAVAQAAWA